MPKRFHILSLLVLLSLALSACTGAAVPSPTPTTAPMESNHDQSQAGEVMETHSAPADAMAEPSPMATSEMAMESETGSDAMNETMPAGEVMPETPDWFRVSLTDTHTETAFTIEAYQGKVVLVETLAMWCSNCLKQQKQVLALHELLGERNDFVSVGLDIDPNEEFTALQEYTQQNGFRWTYAITPAEVSREIGQLYGAQFLNPPSTPMLIIDRDGSVHPLPFGIKSASDLQQALQPFLDAAM